MVVNHISNPTAQSASSSNTFSITSTTGNVLILAIASDASAYNLTSASDSAGSSYTVAKISSSTGGATYIAYTLNLLASISNVTLTGSSGNHLTLSAYDVSSSVPLTFETNTSYPGGDSGSSSSPSLSYAYGTTGLTIAVLTSGSVSSVSSPFILNHMNINGMLIGDATSAYNTSGSFTASYSAVSANWTGNLANFVATPVSLAHTQIGYFLVGI